MSLTQQQKRITILITIMAGLSQFGLILYSPAFTVMAHSLQVSSTAIKNTMTVYLVCLSVVQLIYGPLADRYGRRKPLLIGMLIFIVGAALAIVSRNYFTLLLTRIIQGLGIGACITLSRTILRDSFVDKQYVKMTSYLSIGFALSMAVSPVIGAIVIHYFSWHDEFIVLAMVGIICFLGFFFLLPETLTSRKETLSFREYWLQVFHTYFFIAKNLQFWGFIVAGVLIYTVMVAYMSMGPFLLQGTLGISALQYALTVFLLSLAYYVGANCNRYLMKYLSAKCIIFLGVACVIASGSSMLFIFLVFHLNNVIVIVLPMVTAAFAQALVWPNCIAGALKSFSHVAGTAAALFSFLQMAISGLLLFVVALPKEHNQQPLAIIIILLGVFSLLIFYGVAYRVRSH